jgi:hypothetical protein
VPAPSGRNDLSGYYDARTVPPRLERRERLFERVAKRHLRRFLRSVAIAIGVSLALGMTVAAAWRLGDAFDWFDAGEPRHTCAKNEASASYRVRGIGGVSYRARELRTAWVRVGRRFAPATPVGCAGATTSAHVLAAFPPRTALSLGGSSRRLLIREGVCVTARMESQLLRCLRRASHPAGP